MKKPVARILDLIDPASQQILDMDHAAFTLSVAPEEHRRHFLRVHAPAS